MKNKTQCFLGHDEPRPECVDPIQNADGANGPRVKPLGGIWTSTLNEDGSCGWLEWCRAEEWGISSDTKMWALTPTDDVSVLTIDTLDDLHELLEEFERDDGVVRYPRDRYLDYERIASETEHDGVRVTRNGQRETRLSRPGLYGWDAESTVWFEWVFTDVEYVRDVSPSPKQPTPKST